MSKIETGGPAFPKVSDNPFAPEGMTMRDYFAAKAMLVIATFASHGLHNLGDGVSDVGKSAEEKIATDSYRLADAMLKARES